MAEAYLETEVEVKHLNDPYLLGFKVFHGMGNGTDVFLPPSGRPHFHSVLL